jgi:hypothetical protein
MFIESGKCYNQSIATIKSGTIESLIYKINVQYYSQDIYLINIEGLGKIMSLVKN